MTISIPTENFKTRIVDVIRNIRTCQTEVEEQSALYDLNQLIPILDTTNAFGFENWLADSERAFVTVDNARRLGYVMCRKMGFTQSEALRVQARLRQKHSIPEGI